MKFLKVLFSFICVFMIGVSVWATMQENLAEGFRHVWPLRWAMATLADAFFGFITFWIWVCYKERSNLIRAMWLVLIICLGNIAMSLYILLNIWRLKPGAKFEDLLLRSEAK